MGFTINFHGSVGTAYNVEVQAGATAYFAPGAAPVASSHLGKGAFTKCPIKTTKAQRTNWGARCAIPHTPPEGWTAESFSSDKAFENNSIPTGLNAGDAIFYWKKGVSDDDSAPDGFEAVWKDGDVIVVVPAGADTEQHVHSDDDDVSDSYLWDAGSDLDVSVVTSDADDDDDDFDDEDDDDGDQEDNDTSSPF